MSIMYALFHPSNQHNRTIETTFLRMRSSESRTNLLRGITVIETISALSKKHRGKWGPTQRLKRRFPEETHTGWHKNHCLPSLISAWDTKSNRHFIQDIKWRSQEKRSLTLPENCGLDWILTNDRHNSRYCTNLSTGCDALRRCWSNRWLSNRCFSALLKQ